VSLRHRIRKRDAFHVYLGMEGAMSLLLGLSFTLNLVYHVTVVHLNPLQLVLVGTLLETVIFLFEVPTGIVADVVSRRLSILVGILLMGFGAAVEGSFPHFTVVLLSQVFWGLGATFTSGASQAWIADEVGEERAGRAFVRGAQARQIGGVIGILGAVALGSISIQLPIVLGGVLMMLLGALLALIMPEDGFMPAPAGERTSRQQMIHTLRGGLRLVRGRTILLIFLGVSAIHGLYSEGFDRLWTAHLLADFTLPHGGGLSTVMWFGMISMASMLLSILATEIVRRRVDMRRERVMARALILFQGTMVAAIILFGVAGSFALALSAYLAAAVLRSVGEPLLAAWMNLHIESGVRATVFSMNSQVNAIGEIAGGPVVGAIGTVGSLRAALVVTGLILSPVLALYARALRLGRHTIMDAGVPAALE
jgi:DHA3 family tetracycline resistance protein-like MFS transporter